MRIAITADLHLTTRERHPERFETLENLLDDLRSNEIEMLIIAGDLFDATQRSYVDFEKICRAADNSTLKICVIPGNHDPSIDNSQIVVDNVDIISNPTLRELGGRSFFFLPYQGGKTMGEVLGKYAGNLPVSEWVLIAHGDWTGGFRQPNPTEPGIYMPLTGRDVQMFQPARVFLGHIHASMDAAPVHYPGSPCAIDISETGRRRYLVYDTLSGQVIPRTVATPFLYFNETFVVVPVEDEAGYLQSQIKARQEKWNLSPEEKSRAHLRVKIKGYSVDRVALSRLLEEVFSGYALYEPPNFDDVLISNDIERQAIIGQVRASLEQQHLIQGTDEPEADEILLEAMHIIYGV